MTPEQRHEIIHRFHSGHSMRGIAKDLQLSRPTVSRALRQHTVDRREGPLSADSPVCDRETVSPSPSVSRPVPACRRRWITRWTRWTSHPKGDGG